MKYDCLLKKFKEKEKNMNELVDYDAKVLFIEEQAYGSGIYQLNFCLAARWHSRSEQPDLATAMYLRKQFKA